VACLGLFLASIPAHAGTVGGCRGVDKLHADAGSAGFAVYRLKVTVSSGGFL
jgi:hypothetical protein